MIIYYFCKHRRVFTAIFAIFLLLGLAIPLALVKAQVNNQSSANKIALSESNGLSGGNGVLPGGDSPVVTPETESGVANPGNDAIAVRVLPNPNHYSAARWYQSQGFKGSPQSLLVDGYDAVRDGRTVYVNAAKLGGQSTIYTNIYLISYTQTANVKTVDALGQIISHWQFNSDFTSGNVGYCSISILVCRKDDDCGENMRCCGSRNIYSCSLGDDELGRCIPYSNFPVITKCSRDSECVKGTYCSSLRARLTRDTRRLGILGDLKESLANFKKVNGKYPVLSAGTYLPQYSVSTWPSWQSLFLAKIGASQVLLDPINALGLCDGYDQTTCWRASTNEFAGKIGMDGSLSLPTSSYAFIYSSDKNGANYHLCAFMETANQYNTADGQLSSLGCAGSTTGYSGSIMNSAPILISTALQGERDQEFKGFIKVTDADGDPLRWSINAAGTSSSWPNWSAAPILKDTNNASQKQVYAKVAGNTGTYNFSIKVEDGQGGILITNASTSLKIINNLPLVKADDIQYYPSTVAPLVVRFSITDKHRPFTYSLTKATYNSGPYDLLSSGHSQLISASSTAVGDTTNYVLKYNVFTSNQFPVDTNFVYVIKGTDKYNASTTRQINITVKPEAPKMDFNCAKNVRIGQEYECKLGPAKQGSHTVVYSAVSGLPAGLSIVKKEAISICYPNGQCVVSRQTNPWRQLVRWVSDLLFGNRFVKAADEQAVSDRDNNLRDDSNELEKKANSDEIKDVKDNGGEGNKEDDPDKIEDLPNGGDDTDGNINPGGGGNINPGGGGVTPTDLPYYYYLVGTPTTASASAQVIKIKAVNEYGATAQREFNLNINNYCGDGQRQLPNFEGRGGFYNDGQEDCDGNAGIITNRNQIASSGPTMQYGCNTKPGQSVPYPILDNQSYCNYLSPNDENGGGYCGDGICQAKIYRNNVLIPWEDGKCGLDCTCSGPNQSVINDVCTCGSGYYDCNIQPGCESTTPCGSTCPAGQYRCNNTCVSFDNTNFVRVIGKCFTGSGEHGACSGGTYNCDMLNDCESTGQCACASGSTWNNASWPNGNCECNNSNFQMCGGPSGSCYNPTSHKCCPATELSLASDIICSKNQVCCQDASGAATCLAPNIGCKTGQIE